MLGTRYPRLFWKQVYLMFLYYSEIPRYVWISRSLVRYTVLSVAIDNVSPTQMDSPRVQELGSRGAIVHGVDYSNQSQLTEILGGTDVVISTVNYSSVNDQVRTLLHP
jgi:hypothetical protein